MTNKISLAGCLIINDQQQFLLIHRNATNRIQWELPGGKIELNENPKTAAIRELKEELGIEVVITSKLGNKEFNEDGNLMDYHWFIAKIVSGEPTIKESKFDQIQYFSFKDLNSIPLDLSANMKSLLIEYNQGKIHIS